MWEDRIPHQCVQVQQNTLWKASGSTQSTKSRQEEPRCHWLESEEHVSPWADSGHKDLSLVAIGEARATHTVQVAVEVNHKPIIMHVDTGAAVCLLQGEYIKSKFPGAQLKASTLLQKTYTGEVLEVLSELLVEVEYKQQSCKLLSLVVIRDRGACSFGRNWLRYIYPPYTGKMVASVHFVRSPQEMLILSFVSTLMYSRMNLTLFSNSRLN